MNFEPLGDRIIVLQDNPEEKTEAGLIIPQTVQDKPFTGLVVEVGPGAIKENGERREMEIKKGDRIYFSQYSGAKISIEGVEYLMMKEADVIGRFKED